MCCMLVCVFVQVCSCEFVTVKFVFFRMWSGLFENHGITKGNGACFTMNG